MEHGAHIACSILPRLCSTEPSVHRDNHRPARFSRRQDLIAEHRQGRQYKRHPTCYTSYRCQYGERGEIVVAFMESQGSAWPEVQLVAANPESKPIEIRGERVLVQGVVVSG